MTDELPGHVLQALHDKAQRMAEDMTAIQIRFQRGVIDPDQRQAEFEAAVDDFYTDDLRQDKILDGLLPVALSELAAWSWLEGRATA
jgi:hypothetical protein